MESTPERLYTIGDFQDDMDQAFRLHVMRDYEEALKLRQTASEKITGQDFTLELTRATQVIASLTNRDERINVAGNYRNIGATYERLGRDSQAVEAMNIALVAHQSDQKIVDDVYVNRELGADMFYLGAFALKPAISYERTEQSPSSEKTTEFGRQIIAHMRDSRAAFAHADELGGKQSQVPHQYELNGLRRFSMAESLYGDKNIGLKLAGQALRWSVVSEADRSQPDRRRAVIKAAVGGIGALAVNVLVRVPALRRVSLVATQKLL